jgi:hypothetical protein
MLVYLLEYFGFYSLMIGLRIFLTFCKGTSNVEVKQIEALELRRLKLGGSFANSEIRLF